MIVPCSLAVVCASVLHGSVIHSTEIRLTTVGRSVAAEGEYPYQASLRAGGTQFCPGAVLNQRFILTAAHCTMFIVVFRQLEIPGEVRYLLRPYHHCDESQVLTRKILSQPLYTFIVVVGTNSIHDIGDEYFVEKVLSHEDFDVELAINDVSMVLVTEDINFNSKVKPIRLPVAETSSGTSLILTGWSSASEPGSLSSMLQAVTLISLHWQPCRDCFNGSHVHSSQICSLTKTGHGACLGDSGGPLVEGEQVVGIMSWGMPCARGYPDVSTSVYYFRNWILNQIYLEFNDFY